MKTREKFGILDNFAIGCWTALIMTSIFIGIVPEKGFIDAARNILSSKSGLVLYYILTMLAVGSLIEKIYLLLNALIEKISCKSGD